jgi:hypothetical protein
MRTSAFFALAGMALGASVASAQVVAFDTISGTTVLNVPAGGGSAASTGSRQLGQAINLNTSLVGTAPQITGFDYALLNNTGASITLQGLSLNYWVYGGWTPGAGTTPAFNTLLGSGTVPFTLPGTGFTLPANQFSWITGDGSQAGGGLLPGVGIAPITVPDATQPIGVVFQWVATTTVGGTLGTIGGLTGVISGGTGAIAPSVGANAFGPAGGSQGYYRSAAGESTGNFQQNSARNIGANTNLLSRVWAVPSPSTVSLLALGGLVAARRRRN